MPLRLPIGAGVARTPPGYRLVFTLKKDAILPLFFFRSFRRIVAVPHDNGVNIIHRTRHNMKIAIIPQDSRRGVSVSVSSRACRDDGKLFSEGDRITSSNLHSRVVLTLRSSDESELHRVAALCLLQSGGEAHFSKTMHDAFGRLLSSPVSLGVVLLPAGVEVLL